MTEDPVSQCRECGSPVERVFHPVAVRFKGSGFYTTDYGRGSGGGKRKEAPVGNGEKDKGEKPAADKPEKSTKAPEGS